MKIDKLIINVPKSTNGYPHLNSMKFYGYDNTLIKVSPSSNSSIIFNFPYKKIGANCSAPQYSNSYQAFYAFNEIGSSSWWCAPAMSSADWILSFNENIEVGFDILKITWVDAGTMSTSSKYTVKLYNNSNLLKSISIPVKNNGGEIVFTDFCKIIVYKDGKYFYRKVKE